eukprot:1445553-Prymnesium_polylepis.1
MGGLACGRAHGTRRARPSEIMGLTDDEDDDENEEGEEGEKGAADELVGGAGKKRKSVSGRAEKRAAGGRRNMPYNMLIPLCYKREGDGFQ